MRATRISVDCQPPSLVLVYGVQALKHIGIHCDKHHFVVELILWTLVGRIMSFIVLLATGRKWSITGSMGSMTHGDEDVPTGL